MASIVSRTRGYLANVYRDVRHGAQLKFLAIASRGVFLLFVALRLQPGELAEYVFLSSIAVLGARVLSLGLDEQLPLLIAGRLEAAAEFAPVVSGLLVIQFVLAALFVLTGSVFVAVPLLMTCYLTTSLKAGILRTVRIAGSERLRDLHWVMFVGILLFPMPWTAVQMLGLLAASLMAVQLLEVVLNRVQGIAQGPPLREALAHVADQAALSWRKLLAGAAILVLVRAIILWPKTLHMEVALDTIAYALLLGEAFWQTAMILVYRRYAKYCATPDSPRAIFSDAAKSVAVIIAYGGVAASVALGLGFVGFSLAGFSSWNDVALMIVFFACLASYILVRYVVWVARDFDWRLSLLEIVLFLTQGAIVVYTSPSLWPGLFALAISVFLVLVMLYSRASLAASGESAAA